MAITRAQQVRQMYKEGSMKPVKQAGVMNYMPSEMVTVPKIAKSSPDTPTAKLAYITPEEQDILIDLNLYGSLDGKPNRGPGGIPSLEGDFGSPTGSTYSGGSAGEDGGSFKGGGGGPPPGSPDYNRTARTIRPELPPGVPKSPSKEGIPPGPLFGLPSNDPYKFKSISMSCSSGVMYASFAVGVSGDDLAIFGTVTISEGM